MKVYVLKGENNKLQKGNSYRFKGKRKTVLWPILDGALLGPVGSWNILFRLGMQPEYFTPGDEIVPSKSDLLFAIAEGEVLEASVHESVKRWLDNGGIVIAGGFLPAWNWCLPAKAICEQTHCEYPYAGLAWKFGDDQPELVAPPLWSYGRLINNGDVVTTGKLIAISGECQTPQRALAVSLDDAPAIIRHKNFIFLNGNPFAAFQAWLQGQQDLEPWLRWRNRMFWLDEQAAFLFGVINEYAQLPQKLVPRQVAGLPERVVVFRHDLDHSRDISYLKAEQEAALVGVHAVLRDKNTGFWLKVLARAPEHETAFHYSTATYNRWFEELRARCRKLPKRSCLPARHKIVGDGLLRQVLWAKKRGVGVTTIHRHAFYLIYPEWIDAIHNVYREIPEVLGSSSLFSGQVLRWNNDRTGDALGSHSDFPGSQYPYWFPCKLAHAGLGGRPLRGWETASVMEIEPELFKQMLDHHVPGILQKVITINYHPAHARRSTFCSQGSLSWFRDILKIVKERNVEVKTLRDVYTAVDKAVIKKRKKKNEG